MPHVLRRVACSACGKRACSATSRIADLGLGLVRLGFGLFAGFWVAVGVVAVVMGEWWLAHLGIGVVVVVWVFGGLLRLLVFPGSCHGALPSRGRYV